MKRLIQLSTALLVSIVITACGGGGTDAATNKPDPADPSLSGKLVIDNGRGTTNNQDTERVK